MDAANQRLTQFTARFQRFSLLAWYTLRSPKLTGGLITILVFVSLVGLLTPQQSTPRPDAALWIATLPAWIQFWGEPLFLLGFARIFQSLWFWLPLALLLLNSLIALADYGPGVWKRLGKTVPPIEWQHPLARRAEHIVRLPKSPDTFLETLRTTLAQNGFFIYQTLESEKRITGAARRPWAWLGLNAIYAGLILLVAAILVSYYFLQTDRFTLVPLEAKSSHLFGGKFELAEAGDSSNVGQVTYTSDQAGQPLQTLTWRPYQLNFFNTALILPLAVEAILTVEVRDSTATLLTLIPVQEDLAPAERLNLPLSETDEALYFLISPASLAVQMSPDPSSTEKYNVQIRRGSESSPSENIEAQLGQPFEIDGLSVTASLNHNLAVAAYRDPALALYIISLLLIVVGAVFTLWRPPVQLWLIPEVKGLGGQLYGVVESFGSLDQTLQSLKQLLAAESEAGDQ